MLCEYYQDKAKLQVKSSSGTLTIPEVHEAMNHFLRTLHSAFDSHKGPRAIPSEIWDTYVDVTKSTIMSWDDANRHRLPDPRSDGSIFVSLGTYRGVETVLLFILPVQITA